MIRVKCKMVYNLTKTLYTVSKLAYAPIDEVAGFGIELGNDEIPKAGIEGTAIGGWGGIRRVRQAWTH